MSALTLRLPRLPRFDLTRAMMAVGRSHTVQDADEVATDAEDARRRRGFLLDTLDRGQGALVSEADVQCMMHFYPGRF